MVIRFALSAAVLVSVLVLPNVSYPVCKARTGLNGLWKGSDDGKYHIAAHGNDVWWMGETGQQTNVFKGTVDGSFVNGSWADVLSSTGHFGVGTLRLEIVRTPGGGIANLRKVSGTGSGLKRPRRARFACRVMRVDHRALPRCLCGNTDRV